MGLRNKGSVIGNFSEASSSSASGMWTGQEVYTYQKANSWQVAPTFVLSSSAASVNEGASVTFTLATTGIPNGTVIPYTIAGANITIGDASPFTGNFVIANNTSTVSIAANSDLTVEGTEYMLVSAAGQTANVTINDTLTGEAQYPYVTLLLQADSVSANTQNNTFLDSSTNNLTITRNGDATQGTFAPFGDSWSTYFNNNMMSTTPSAAYTWGTGDYTIEMWYNPSVSYAAGNGYLFDQGNNNTHLQIYNNYIRFLYNTGATELTASTAGAGLTVGTWYHLAIVRATGVITMYLNGTSLATVASSANETSTSMNIGNYGGGGYGLNGYISNFRCVKGTAVYTANFTPPTTPLTPIAGTTLLTLQSPTFKDNSATSSALAISGTPKIQRFSPFSNYLQTPTSYSTKFNGSTDYLSLASNAAFTLGTGNFTVEMWVYPTVSAAAGLVSFGNGGSVQPYFYLNGLTPTFYYNSTGVASGPGLTLNTWTHIAFVRVGTSFNVYTNGVAGSTASTGDSFTNAGIWVGANDAGAQTFTGFMSDVRIVKGTAVYTANFTPPTAPLTAITNTSLLTCRSPTIVDNSSNAFAITAAGTPTPKKFNPFGYTNSAAQNYSPAIYGGSMYFDGTGDYLSSSGSTAFTMGTSPFTVEYWVYQTVDTGTYTQHCGSAQGGSGFGYGTAGLNLYMTTSVSGYQATGAIKLFEWNHVVWTRNSSNDVKCFLNGVLCYGPGNIIGTNITETNFGIGASTTAGYTFSGYLSDIRINKSVSLYTSNFVPPTAPSIATANTSILLSGTNAGIYDGAMEIDFQTVGDAKISTTQKKYGTGSMYFDGTGDWVRTSSTQALNSGDFTFEMWLYPLDTVDRHIFSFGAGWSPADGISLIQYGGNYAVSLGAASTANSGQAIQINGWHHIALVRSGTSVKFYYDGSVKFTGTDSTNLTTTLLNIGCADAASWGPFYGYIDDLRITRGYARYTTTFTPPGVLVGQ